MKDWSVKKQSRQKINSYLKMAAIIETSLRRFSYLIRCTKKALEEGFFGTPERIRTSDLRFRKPLLYPTELQVPEICFAWTILYIKHKKVKTVKNNM